ncbi:replication initiator protein [Microviridae sp.]|nr:replication initiator protein [Microviridae sp.]
MQCTSPLTGYRAVEGGGLVYNHREGYADKPLTVRCGQCMGCRLERSRVWAIRCVHEASLYDNNIFVTFTYDDENLPYGETLIRSEMPKFIKRLRKKVPNARTFYCGEYGDETVRPHYHALLFDYEPNDKEIISMRDGKEFYRSDKLDALWGLGHCNFSDVTFQSAAYTAGYITKKITGDQSKEHYEWIDETTGQIVDRLPEFQGQSLKPGIGQKWALKWLHDVYPRDQIIIEGMPTRPPRYYDQLCEIHRPDLWAETIKRRKLKEPKWVIDEKEINSRVRRAVRRDIDPDLYYGSSRQHYARDKIIKSKQRKRKEQ